MKTMFLGGLAARVAPRILGKMTEKLDTSVLAELTDMQRLIPALAEAEIVVAISGEPISRKRRGSSFSKRRRRVST